MKVKDLIRSLESQNPDDEIVMKNLFQNTHEPPYVLKKIRTYMWKGKVIIDGYDKIIEKNES